MLRALFQEAQATPLKGPRHMTTAEPPTGKLNPGLTATAIRRVTDAMTAPVVGSGAVPVLASPMMIAIMEEAAAAAVHPHLSPGMTTLGVHLDVTHTAATPVGLVVTAEATLVSVDGRKLEFTIEARDEKEPIGRARHTRIVVDEARFLARLESKR